MPTKIATAMASGEVAQAAASLVRDVRTTLSGVKPALVAVFASTAQPLEALMRCVADEFPGATCLGASTAGEFTERGDAKGSAVLFALAGDYEVFGGIGTGLKADAEGAVGSALEGLPRELHGYPSLKGTFFDIAPGIGARKLEEAGLMDRFEVVEGDFFSDPLPGDHDVILLSSVMHVYRPEQNIAVLQRARESASRGTRLLLLDYWLNATHTAPLFNVLMAGEFLVVEGGDSYSAEEGEEWLARSGWHVDSHRQMTGPASLLVATAA